MEYLNPLLRDLNDQQRAAVLQQDGPVLIIAGAGSGKTRVLTSKVALLLQGGAAAESILAITFTKKAAGEMRDRVRYQVGSLIKGLSIGTFHSVFARFLRTYHEQIGFPQDFTIYDEDNSESCIKACVGETLWGPDWNDREKLKAMSEEQKKARKAVFKIYNPHTLHGIISRAKNDLVLPRQYRSDPAIQARDAKFGREKLGAIYELYMKKCKAAAAMDFDDILVYMYYLLRRDRDVRTQLASRFEHILVDEYQDTNRVQYEIVHMLASVHGNLCVVGDDSQSIYAFRGAKIENILNFKDDYPELKVFRLETNYRSTGRIVEAANRLIAHNEARLPKTCRSSRGAGSAIEHIVLEDDREEARYVKGYIMDRVAHAGARYKDFAVLYRTNAQARALEDELLKARVPYLVYSGMSFFDRAEVKDVLAYLRLVVNPRDDEAFKRVCNRPARSISDATLTALMAAAARTGASLFTEARGAEPEYVAVKPKACQALRDFAALLSSLRQETAGMDAFQAATRIVEKTGIMDYYQGEEGEDGLKKANNIKELLSSIMYFIADRREEYENDLPGEPLRIGLGDYLESIALLSNADTDTRQAGTTDCVSLMTSHCSKGLEFPTVLLVGCEESLYPLIKEDSTHFDEEEERRLFYVSVTRAKDKLILTSCRQRWKYGNLVELEPSRFLDEMEIDECNAIAMGSAAETVPALRQGPAEPEAPAGAWYDNARLDEGNLHGEGWDF